MIKMQVYGSREEWLKARTSCIGGSDAASLLGLSPYRDNVELWELKTGRSKAADISDNPAVKYGTDAEKYLRDLFAMDYPKFELHYVENNIWTNDEYPFAHASLDGWLTDELGRLGILEIKTSTIQKGYQRKLWNKRIPDNYYIQVLHYMMVTGAEFAILKAQLTYNYGDDETFIETRHYRIDRTDEVEQDIKYLIEAEKSFADAVKQDKRPTLILPAIWKGEMMELKVNEIATPDSISFNYEELKAELAEKLQTYETIVYSDEQIKDAKADKASLNRLKKALNDERIRQEKIYMKPFNDFKDKINELIDAVNKPIEAIDAQIKEYEEKRKAEKRIEIGSIWQEVEHPEWLKLSSIFVDEWLNATYSIKKIETDIRQRLDKIKSDMAVISYLPQFSEAALVEYKRTLDVERALNKGKELTELAKVINKPEEAAGADMAKGYEEGIKKSKGESIWISFKARMTVEQATALKVFFVENEIEYRTI